VEKEGTLRVAKPTFIRRGTGGRRDSRSLHLIETKASIPKKTIQGQNYYSPWGKKGKEGKRIQKEKNMKRKPRSGERKLEENLLITKKERQRMERMSS